MKNKGTISYKKIHDTYYSLVTKNDFEVAKAIRDIDGFYYLYVDPKSGGLWNEYSLRQIADILRELNQPYEEHINEYFKDKS